MLLRLVQSANTPPSIEVTLSGIVILVSPELLNVLPAIEVTLSGIVILVRLEQFWNALLPIKLTLSGIVILVRLEQFRNALLPIEVTGKPLKVLGMSKDPLAVSRQLEKIYPLLSPFRVNVSVFV